MCESEKYDFQSNGTFQMTEILYSFIKNKGLLPTSSVLISIMYN